MCLHYLVKLIAQFLSPYITNTPCFVTKSYIPMISQFTKMWKCSLTRTGNVDLLMLFCSVSLFAVSFTENALSHFTTAACDWKSQTTLKTVTANVISITGKEYIMYISKHDGNSCWLLNTVVSTVSENWMRKVHNLYGKICNVQRHNLCYMFYKVV